MPTVEVGDSTYGALRIAANAAGVSVADVIDLALRALADTDPRPPSDPWAEVGIHAEYLGTRVEARFLPATRRVVITTGPLADTTYATPSAAAGAVVAHHGRRTDTRTNGWRFWRVTDTGAYIETVRANNAGRHRQT